MGKNYHKKLPQNSANGHKMYQMDLKYAKWTQNVSNGLM
jgi:hypothetical protein